MKKLIIAAAVAAACVSAKTQAEHLFDGILDIAGEASAIETTAESGVKAAQNDQNGKDADPVLSQAEAAENQGPGQNERAEQHENAESAPEGSEDAKIFSIDLREEPIAPQDAPIDASDGKSASRTDSEAPDCADDDVYGYCEDGSAYQDVALKGGKDLPNGGSPSLLQEKKSQSRGPKGNGWAPRSVISAPAGDLPALPEAEVLPIARGHLNRIITPFEKPEAKTSADVSIEIRGSVAYIAADSPQPFTVYFTETGDEETALTAHFMAVSGMPSPIDLRTKMPSKARNALDAEGFAEKLSGGMAAAAAGKTPHGFERTDEFRAAPCRYPGVGVSGSIAYFENSEYAISVHEARMTEKTGVRLDDAACDPNDAAIGFYPLHELRNIGDTTFIIAARKKEDRQ